MKLSFVLLAAMVTAPLGGCISLLPKPPPAPKVYTLEAGPPPQAPAGAAKQIVIAVAQPDPPRALSGADIAWMKDGRIAYVDGAQWAGRGPDLLQALLVHTIDRSGGVRGAVRAGEGRADSEITWDLITFGVVENGAPQARFVAQAKLFGARSRALIATLEVDESAPLSGRSSAAAAQALQEASRRAAAKIAAWAVANTPEPDTGPARP